MRIIVFAFIILPTFVFTQRTNVYGTVGSFFISHSVTTSFEFKLQNSIDPLNGFYFKTNSGVFGGTNPVNSSKSFLLLNLAAGITYLAKADNNNALDLSIGLSYVDSFNFDKGLAIPTGSIGFRFVNDNSLIRFGVAFPEGIYFSYGFIL